MQRTIDSTLQHINLNQNNATERLSTARLELDVLHSSGDNIYLWYDNLLFLKLR